MKTLEDRLDRASGEVRRGVAEMPSRPASALGRRLNQRRTMTVTAALMLVFGSFAGTALLLTGESRSPVATQPSAVTPVPTTTSIPTSAGVAAIAPLSTLPVLGLDLPGWVGIDATEEDGSDGGFRSIIYYLPSEQGSPFVVVKLWIRGIPEGSSHESSLWWMNRPDFTPVVIRGHDARVFESNGDFDFGWRESGDAVVTLSVLSGLEAVTQEQATAIAASVTDLNPDMWAELLLLAPSDGVILESPTTTTLIQQP